MVPVLFSIVFVLIEVALRLRSTRRLRLAFGWVGWGLGRVFSLGLGA